MIFTCKHPNNPHSNVDAQVKPREISPNPTPMRDNRTHACKCDMCSKPCIRETNTACMADMLYWHSTPNLHTLLTLPYTHLRARTYAHLFTLDTNLSHSRTNVKVWSPLHCITWLSSCSMTKTSTAEYPWMRQWWCSISASAKCAWRRYKVAICCTKHRTLSLTKYNQIPNECWVWQRQKCFIEILPRVHTSTNNLGFLIANKTHLASQLSTSSKKTENEITWQSHFSVIFLQRTRTQQPVTSQELQKLFGANLDADGELTFSEYLRATEVQLVMPPEKKTRSATPSGSTRSKRDAKSENPFRGKGPRAKGRRWGLGWFV